MKFKFNLSKKDMNDFLSITQSKFDVLYLFTYSILYFYITYFAIKFDFKTILLYYVISVIILYLIISVIKKLFRVFILKKNKNNIGEYTVEVDKNKIKQIVNKDNEVIIKKDEIKKIIYKKYCIIIYLKNKESISFIKKVIKLGDYTKLNKYLKDNF